MASTFGLLSTAASGLAAARAGMDVIGQNVANVETEGYTRQRVAQSPLSARWHGIYGAGFNVGAGVKLEGAERLGNALLDGRVRNTAAASGHWSVQYNALTTLEASLGEPAGQGLSSRFDAFWAAWQQLGNDPSQPASAMAVIENGRQLATQIAETYRGVQSQWSDRLVSVASDVDEVNRLAQSVASFNDAIRIGRAAGSSVNELIDQRALATNRLAELTGSTVRQQSDGTVDVLVDGIGLVLSGSARPVRLAGAIEMGDASAHPVTLEFADRPGTAITLSGGTISGGLAVLAPASGGGGGPLALAASRLNDLATRVATSVNAVHSAGANSAGTTGLNFFALAAGGVPAALGLSVVPTSGADIAHATAGAGAWDGSVADAIANLGSDPNGADAFWTEIVSSTAISTQLVRTQATLSEDAHLSAVSTQRANTAVDLDEETTLLLTYQHAYQGAARMVTAIDEMLDTLINRTGVVGR